MKEAELGETLVRGEKEAAFTYMAEKHGGHTPGLQSACVFVSLLVIIEESCLVTTHHSRRVALSTGNN